MYPWKEFARLSNAIWDKFSTCYREWKGCCIKVLYFNSVSNVDFLERIFLGGSTLWSETRIITSMHLLSHPCQGRKKNFFQRCSFNYWDDIFDKNQYLTTKNLILKPINLVVERFLTQIYNCFSHSSGKGSKKNKGSLLKKERGGGHLRIGLFWGSESEMKMTRKPYIML